MIKGGINHVALGVKNLQQAEKFYVGMLGLKRVGQRYGMHFYSSGNYNHELALVENPSATLLEMQQGGLAHIAFNVEATQALKTLREKLVAKHHPVSVIVDHIISHSFYTRDVDGYLIELTVDRPIEEWELNSQAYAQNK